MTYKKQYEEWITSPHLDDEEKKTLENMNEEERQDAFYRDLEFGTAGMRGRMGIGPNRMNRYMIRLAAKGLAMMLGSGSKVAVAYDTRNNSRHFAEETAGVLAASGIDVFLFDRYSPVPLLSYTVRKLGCDGGVVITASHNFKEYNGFKVYNSAGCQMDVASTETISANMRKIEDRLGIKVAPVTDGHISLIGDEVIDGFLKEVMKSSPDVGKAAASSLNIVYTSLHGSGREYVKRVLADAGFDNVSLVKAQQEYNGDFPTVIKPNPEEQQALAMAGQQLLDEEADILIGTDPDCDRVGVGVRKGKDVIYLSGNQTGALLIDFLARTGDPAGKTLITTVVTGEIGPRIAESYGIKVVKTLTGFKNICGVMEDMEPGDFFMGYEESYGYLTGFHARDKDGVSTALAVCRLAAYYKSRGMTLTDALGEIYSKHGYWMDRQESFVFEGEAGEKRIKNIMSTLRKDEDEVFASAGNVKKVVDFSRGVDGLPVTNLLKFFFEDGSWLAVRPSGTEPKIKFYYCIKDGNEAFFTKLSQLIHAFC